MGKPQWESTEYNYKGEVKAARPHDYAEDNTTWKESQHIVGDKEAAFNKSQGLTADGTHLAEAQGGYPHTSKAEVQGQQYSPDYNAQQTSGDVSYHGTQSSSGITKPPLERKHALNEGFTFEYYNKATGDRKHITLLINPEEFTVTEPARITVTQTKGGAFVDHFGQGLKQVTIRGVTGYKPPQREGKVAKTSGHFHFIELRKLIRDWTEFAKDPSTSKDHVMRFYNWTDEEYWEIAITQFNLMRATNRPMLYQYNITFIVLRDIDRAPKEYDTGDEHMGKIPYYDYLMAPESRVPIVAAKVNTETGFLNNIINKVGDMTGLSTGTQIWGSLIAKGAEVYDTVSGTYKTITSVISEVERTTRSIGLFVDGVTSFISKPFESVQNITITIGDIIDDLCAVSDLPHELIRSFREIICALRALPESLFGGFSNPSLFEGNSNCGASMGIPDAPVSFYDNSFEATAKVPSERTISQAFSIPVKTIILKEQPTEVPGVYLATDISRTGNNYLESWSGSEVTLTSVPEVPIIIDYNVRQSSTVDMLKLQASDGMIIKYDDTLERISYNAYGDASQWKLIALYNDLEYPFIVDPDFDEETEATGYVRFYRSSSVTTAITILVGTSVWVPTYRGTRQINFVTTATKVLDLSNTYVDVPVQAVPAGEIGNVAPTQITGFTDFLTGIPTVYYPHYNDLVSAPYTIRFPAGSPYLFIGSDLPFSKVTFTVTTPNTIASVMTCQYWNGTDWVSLTSADHGWTDGTISAGTKTLGQTGSVVFTQPSDWQHTSIATDPTGPATDLYWLKITVSSALTVTSAQSVISTASGIVKVSNVSGFAGGKIWKVMHPGDVILIPRTEGSVANVVYGAKKDYDAMFGIDIAVGADGEFDVANETLNDLKRVYGVKNLVQALRNRIQTQRRYYSYHPEYGTDLPYYIGRKNITHWQDLVKVDIKGGVQLDPRIAEVKQFKMIIDGQRISMNFDAIPINQHTSLPLNLII